jgi:hypothetical protein
MFPLSDVRKSIFPTIKLEGFKLLLPPAPSLPPISNEELRLEVGTAMTNPSKTKSAKCEVSHPSLETGTNGGLLICREGESLLLLLETIMLMQEGAVLLEIIVLEILVKEIAKAKVMRVLLRRVILQRVIIQRVIIQRLIMQVIPMQRTCNSPKMFSKINFILTIPTYPN